MSLIITGDWSDDTDSSAPTPERYVLRLYVAGASSNSTRAISNLRAICEEHLSGMYDLEVIDVQHDHETVEQEQIIALPMMLRLQPAPRRRLIGDMSNKEQVMRGLGLI